MPKINMVPALSVTDSQIGNIIETTSADVFWKTNKGDYLGVNQQFLKVSNLTSFDDVIGMKDTDFIWADQAQQMMSHDQEVIATTNSNYYLEAAKSPKGPVIKYLNYKTPLKARSGKIIGVFGLSIPVTDADSMARGFNEIAIIINKQLKKIIKLPMLLSKQQYNCLYYLVKGMSYKQIAAALQLSSKTVEHYINNVKIKLNCSTRSDLVEKALQMDTIKNELL